MHFFDVGPTLVLPLYCGAVMTLYNAPAVDNVYTACIFLHLPATGLAISGVLSSCAGSPGVLRWRLCGHALALLWSRAGVSNIYFKYKFFV